MKIELKKNVCIKMQAYQIGDIVEMDEGSDLNYFLKRGFAVKSNEKSKKEDKAEK